MESDKISPIQNISDHSEEGDHKDHIVEHIAAVSLFDPTATDVNLFFKNLYDMIK
jgi:hypothetical protein